MTNHSRLLAAFALLAVSLGGCAFGERQANLQYPPPAGNGNVVKEAQASPAPVRAEAPLVAIMKFEDKRTEQAVVGHVRNGWGMKTAEVVSPTDVSAWVGDGLQWELERAGFRVKRMPGGSTADTNEAVASVSGEVIRTYSDAYFSYEGEVTIRAIIARSGKEVYSNIYTGTGAGGINMAATGTSYARTLSLALQDSLSKLVTDIVREAGGK